MHDEEFVGFPANGGFLGFQDQFALFPLKAIRSAAVYGFAKLGAGEDGRVHAFRDFLAFPLGEDPEQMKEHPASGSARVDRFTQRNEVGLVLPEKIREVFELAPVAGEAGELRKDQAGDMVALDVLHHAPGLRVLHDGLAALAGEVIHLFDRPAAAPGVASRPFLVMLRAFALGLVFG